ncbi:MAG: ferrous iron transport protein A [Phycisphaerales bacterium]
MSVVTPVISPVSSPAVSPAAPAPALRVEVVTGVGGRMLSEMRVGERAVVCEARVNAEGAAVLRAMGLRPSASVRVCRAGEPCIVEIGSACGMSCRIGLAKSLADRVLVSAADGDEG